MTSAFDQRIIRVGLEIEGETTYFDGGFDIVASGRKFTSSQPSFCDLRISNLTEDHRAYILSKASPLAVKGNDRKGIFVTLEVGRESYGTSLLYEGTSFACRATQPPDIGIVLQSMANNLSTGYVQGFSQSGIRPLRTICEQVAKSIKSPRYPDGLSLDFQVVKNAKNINNYCFTGAALSQVQKLNEMGGIKAFIDNGKLRVIDADVLLEAAPRKINMNTGMVGVPQVTDSGVQVTVMLDNSIELASSVEIESQINPPANGIFQVAQIAFDVASRADPFYFTLFCSNLVYMQGTT